MGVGKTTVGKLVARKLGRQFIDTDKLIEQRAGLSIPEIFKQHGEWFFRAYETSICEEFSKPQNLVIATGGGALVHNNNLERITGEGNIVLRLGASVQAVIDRLAGAENRPLFNNPANPREAVLKLFEKRRIAYQQLRTRIDTTDRTPEDVADEVIRLFEREVTRNSYRLLVKSPVSHYSILVNAGVMNELPQILDDYGLKAHTAVVTNETLRPLYGEQLANLLDAVLITIPDGEIYKSLATVEQLYHDFINARLDRSSLVVALGGGVLGDTVGYAAATYLRGVRLVQVPTSLLAMVDSSVGGKVGVDLPEGKNLVGAFKQPELVAIDTHVLESLPDVEIRCGLAEAIKHALLADPTLLECIEAIRTGDAAVLRRAIKVKVDVVERDPYESGERAHLNLGHTFAHAIEKVSDYQWRHGEAVGVGLVAAAYLSAELGRLGGQDVEKIAAIVDGVGLPTRINGFSPDSLWNAMSTDKKWKEGRTNFVVLDGIGSPTIVEDVTRDQVFRVLEQLQA